MNSYKDGVWIFVYFPKSDFLRCLFKGSKKGYWPYGTDVGEAVVGTSSHEGRERFQTNDWQSFYIDTDLTKDWRTAWALAARHFNTLNTFTDQPESGGDE